MIHFHEQSRFATISLTLLALIALTVTGCKPQKQAGRPEKVGGDNHDQQRKMCFVQH